MTPDPEFSINRPLRWTLAALCSLCTVVGVAAVAGFFGPDVGQVAAKIGLGAIAVLATLGMWIAFAGMFGLLDD
jgi:hypothetical protein